MVRNSRNITRIILPLLCVSSLSNAENVGDSPSSSQGRRLGLGAGGYDNEDAKSSWTDKTEGEHEDVNKDEFYDLTPLSKDEKLGMIKMAYSLTQYGDGINWNMQRDNFIHTVLEDKSSFSQHSQSSADLGSKYDDEYDGNLDDTLDIQVPKDDDDAYNGMLDDTLDGKIVVTSADNGLMKENYGTDGNAKNDEDTHGNEQTNGMLVSDILEKQTSRRRLQLNNIDGAVFDGYEYNKGNCPEPGSLGVPCAPDNISSICNKYDRTNGSFSACLEACKPAFCCIHDAPPSLNYLAPNCNADENCSQYNYCYIVWWKLHDTVGPALFLRVEQDDEFYDIEAGDIEGDNTGDSFFVQVLLHHFDDIDEVIADGTLDNEFNADRIFLDEEYWSYPVANKVDVSDP